MGEKNLVARIFKSHNFTVKELLLNFRVFTGNYGIGAFRSKGIRIFSVDQTIEHIIEHRAGIARFGDGEISIMAGAHGVGFQDLNTRLAEELQRVITTPLPNLLIGLPDQLLCMDNSVRKTRKFWTSFLIKHREFLLNCLSSEIIYGNASLTRFYMLFKDKESARNRFESLKLIWAEKDVLIVEGALSRSGIGNDLFDEARSISRLICPSRNAFDNYADILAAVEKLGQNRLILLALGPTATVLAHELASKGLWALDMGHIDVEYMWCKKNATSKIRLEGKSVNEADDSSVEEFGPDLLELYESQIVGVVSK